MKFRYGLVVSATDLGTTAPWISQDMTIDAESYDIRDGVLHFYGAPTEEGSSRYPCIASFRNWNWVLGPGVRKPK